MAFDEVAEYQRQLETVDAMGATLSAIPGVQTEVLMPDAEAGEPYIEVRWDAGRYRITPAELKQALRHSKPSIEIRALFLSDGQIHLTATMLKEGEDKIVTSRVKEILLGSA